MIFPYFVQCLLKSSLIALLLNRLIEVIDKIFNLYIGQILLERKQRVQIGFQQTRQSRQKGNIRIRSAGIT